MNCAWCGANADGSDSHGICQDCSDRLALQSVQRQYDNTPSYLEMNAAAFGRWCEEILSREGVPV